MLKKVLLVSVLMTLLASSPALAESATYYADEYTGSPTASGTPYTPSGMTAAHPSLPLGTVADVCTQDGRCVTVTINDRCACGIDLSRAAAEELGMILAGRMEVTVTPVGEGALPAAAPLPAPEYVPDEGAAYIPEAYEEYAGQYYEDEVFDEYYPYDYPYWAYESSGWFDQ